MDDVLMPSTTVLDPDPDYWLTSERLERLCDMLGPSCNFYILSGLFDKLVQYWIRLEIATECCQNEEAWAPDELNGELDSLESLWLEKNKLSDFYLDPHRLRTKLSVKPAGIKWARWKWAHRLKTLYIDRKANLDRASCLLLRTHEKDLAMELYHRIKAKEISFVQASKKFGIGPETASGGRLPLQTLSSMPLGLGSLLRRLSLGELTLPQRLETSFALVQLNTFEPAVLDNAMEEYLLQYELERWIVAATSKAKLALISVS